MTALVSALYAEGRTDERFLPVLLQRSVTDWLARHASRVVDVLEPIVVDSTIEGTRAERIQAIVQQVSGYHLLFVHADADDDSSQRAYDERVAPGINMITEARNTGLSVCEEVIPIIPVQKVEAWLMADAGSLCTTIGTSLQPQDIRIPVRAEEIERIADPKQRLREIIRLAYAARPRRRRSVEPGELYEPLANRIRLADLERLPSYQHFLRDLDTALRSLHFIPR